MAGYRRRTNRKYPGRSKNLRSNIKRNKSANAQSKQLLTLTRQVSNLRSDTRAPSQWAITLDDHDQDQNTHKTLTDHAFYVHQFVRPPRS